MSVQHVQLAQGRWVEMTLAEQLANVGSEVERALNWRAKHHAEYAQKAYERALELMDFTLGDPKHRARCKELARVREALVDDFVGTNEFQSSEASWRKYFLAFNYLARKDR